MSKAPPIPPDQRQRHDPHPDARAVQTGRHNDPNGPLPDEAIGDEAKRRETLTPIQKVQDR